MAESLDEILSGQREAVPAATEEKQPPTETVTAETQEQPTESPQEGADRQKMVPHEALHAEKQKVKRYTEQVASFEQTLQQRDSAWERKFNQLLEKLGPQPTQAPPVDWFADPDAALKQGLQSALSPVEQQFSNLQTQIMRLTAVQQYGAEKVTAFEKYCDEAIKRNDPEMAALSAQMRSSSDPVGTGLQWFEKRTFDPEAERERIREELRKELEQPQQAHQAAPVLPSNIAGVRNVGTRSGPQWTGPTPLNDIFKR